MFNQREKIVDVLYLGTNQNGIICELLTANTYIYPAISTFAVHICYANKCLLYSYQTNKLFSLRINFPGILQLCTAEGEDKYETGTNVTRITKDTCFCPFCLNLTSFFTLQDKHNIRTLSLNIKFICTRCETGLKSSPKARYSACF